MAIDGFCLTNIDVICLTCNIFIDLFSILVLQSFIYLYMENIVSNFSSILLF